MQKIHTVHKISIIPSSYRCVYTKPYIVYIYTTANKKIIRLQRNIKNKKSSKIQSPHEHLTLENICHMTYNTISYQDVCMNIFCHISFPYQDVHMMNIVFCSISFRINVLPKNNNLMSWCILPHVNLAKHYSKILL